MKNRAQIALSILAAAFLAVGLALIGGTLTHIHSVDQLRRLLSYDYMSFADSRAEGAIGGTANDFFPGIALTLVGSVLLSRVKHASVPAKVVAALLFAFVAVSLVYACVNLRVGAKPY
jgi:hypothetical protein